MNDKLKKTHTLKDLTKDCNGQVTTGANFMESVVVGCKHKQFKDDDLIAIMGIDGLVGKYAYYKDIRKTK